MTKIDALKLEENCSEFTMGVYNKSATEFLKNYSNLMERLEKENTCDEIIELYKSKRELCCAYLKVLNNLNNLMCKE